MRLIYEPTVTVIAATQFYKPDGLPWVTDSTRPGESLIEFSGRACYASWNNPARRTNKEYIENMLGHGHFSVIEHASATFWITGISRSLTHELIRHRHLSYSQESQRYVPDTDEQFVVPPAFHDDPIASALFLTACEEAQGHYNKLLDHLQTKYAHIEDMTTRRKKAREAARSVMPNASETKIVVTGNYRAWRHFIRMRGSAHAEPEIRNLALLILDRLMIIAPVVFGDFTIQPIPTGGREILSKLMAA